MMVNFVFPSEQFDHSCSKKVTDRLMEGMVKALLQYPPTSIGTVFETLSPRYSSSCFSNAHCRCPNTQDILRYHMPKKLKRFWVQTKSEEAIGYRQIVAPGSRDEIGIKVFCDSKDPWHHSKSFFIWGQFSSGPSKCAGSCKLFTFILFLTERMKHTPLQ